MQVELQSKSREATYLDLKAILVDYNNKLKNHACTFHLLTHLIVFSALKDKSRVQLK